MIVIALEIITLTQLGVFGFNYLSSRVFHFYCYYLNKKSIISIYVYIDFN